MTRATPLSARALRAPPCPPRARPEALEQRLLLATFTVTNVNDSGPGSLRQAITSANSAAGTDLIDFAVGTGRKRIAVSSPLPALTGQVAVDGSTQPGYAGTPLIEIAGGAAGATADGLRLTGGGSLLNALSVTGFGDDGISLAGTGHHAVVGCYVGLDPLGAATPNRGDGIEIVSSDNAVGFAFTFNGNVISANFGSGVHVVRAAGDASDPAEGNVIVANRIGTTVDGASRRGNLTNGVFITTANNRVGGTSAGARNVISGNDVNLRIQGGSARGNLVQGNYLGTNAAGTAALLGAAGVLINGAPGNAVGGTAPGAGNLISGNTVGVEVTGLAAVGNVIQGNLIGLRAGGAAALPNTFVGVRVAAPDTLLGGTASGAENVISGNVSSGVVVDGPATNVRIQGNLIGTNRAGSGAVPNGSHGVEISISSGNLVGGDTPAAGNIIAGNEGHGVWVAGSTAGNSNSNRIQGNLIGVGIGGPALGNHGDGVRLDNFTSGNVVGGVNRSEGNVIANNRGDGVFVVSTSSNAVLANGIHDNGGLGIDLAPNGVTPNDLNDVDTGANQLQNFPVITSATSPGMGGTRIRGLLNSLPGNYRIEFFSSRDCDPSDHGEGAGFLGSVDLSIPTAFNVFDTTVPISLAPGAFVSATATRLLPSGLPGATSEFSLCVESTIAVPRVAQVYVSGLDWQPQFMRYLADNGLGSETYGFAVPGGVEQLNELPWTGIDRVTVEFTDDVVIPAGPASMQVHGVNVLTYPVASWVQHSGRVFSWLLARPMVNDKVRLTLDGHSTAGVHGGSVIETGPLLDGEWTDGDTYPSGDGTAGGDFRFKLHVLPGDVNRSGGAVNATDLAQVRARQLTSVASPGVPPNVYTAFHDISGDGRINSVDLAAVRSRQLTGLPTAEPTALPGGAAVTEADSVTKALFAPPPLL